MSRSCAQWRGDIGAYIVGALDGRARSKVSRHLLACTACRAEYDELVPARGWLGLLAPAGGLEPVPAGPPRRGASPPRPGASPPRRLAAVRPAAAGKPLRRLLTAGAAVAAAAALVVVMLIAWPSARGFRAVDSATGVSGQAQLHGTPAGTQIDLTASGLPRGERCILMAVGRGRADIAGSWDATYDGSARIAGTSAIPASQLTALRIESDTGDLLLTIRLSR
jgi:hypothetical protein